MGVCNLCGSTCRVNVHKEEDIIKLLKQFEVVNENGTYICRVCLRKIHFHLSSLKKLCQSATKSSTHHEQQQATGFLPSAKSSVFQTLAGTPQLQPRHASVMRQLHIQPSETPMKTVQDVTKKHAVKRVLMYASDTKSSNKHAKSSVFQTLAGTPQLQPRHSVMKQLHIQPSETPMKTVQDVTKKSAVKRVLMFTNDDHMYASDTKSSNKHAKKKKRTLHQVEPLHELIREAEKRSSCYMNADECGKLIKSMQSQNTNTIANAIEQNVQLMTELNERMINHIDRTASTMGNEIHGDISVLMKKDYDDLKTFSWDSIVDEGCTKFPLLIRILLAISLGKSKLADNAQICKFIPKLGVIMGILLQNRHQKSSLVQRCISTLLFDSISDQKVNFLSI